ncbi:MAG: hypothetical protein AAFY42_08390 [Pseudomonadota bacterium]
METAMETGGQTGVKTPWHIWVVGVLALLWNSGGASDYIQVKLKVESYLQQGADMVGITAADISAYYDAFPIWADISWALGVWGAVAGSVLILLRSRFAMHAFGIALIGLIVTTIYTVSSPMPMGEDAALVEAARTFQMVFSAVIWLSVLLLIYYCFRMTKAGVLR